MTLAEAIAKKSAALPPESQQQVLRFVEALRPKRKIRQARSKKFPHDLPASLKAVYGIWADRTDLPKDSVKAVKVMRARSAERRRNGLEK
jgi:Protein of unknown function (DUF2281)